MLLGELANGRQSGRTDGTSHRELSDSRIPDKAYLLSRVGLPDEEVAMVKSRLFTHSFHLVALAVAQGRVTGRQRAIETHVQ
jgi:hypothetical protein